MSTPFRRVLIVDDVKAIRAFLKTVLYRKGHIKAVEAEDGEQAIRILQNEEFDLIISDFCMPNVDGHALFKWVYENRPELSKHFVFITAYGGEEGLTSLLEEHPTVPVIGKPFSASDLEKFL